MEFYNGTKLLSLNDANGNKPYIYIVTSNRTGGKTTYFNRLVVNHYKKGKTRKFGIFVRFKYDTIDCGDAFFKDIKELFFPGDDLTAVPKINGLYAELYLNGKSCAYVLPINCADALKKKSHFFSDIDEIVFDEFQSETNHYCDDEITKFQSLYASIARGRGKQSRYVPVYMISNPVSIINPYYCAMHISNRISSKSRFLRGNGWVLEQSYIESAAMAMKESGFFQAFPDSSYVAYAAENVYLNDNMTFIDRPHGPSKYVGTLKYNGREYGLREFPDSGIIYCDDRPDSTYRYKLTVNAEDHAVNYVMLRRNDAFINSLRYYFERGAFRFKDLACKDALLSAISII